MAISLRPRQYEWIPEQFLCVTTLLDIPMATTEDGDGALQHCVDTKAEDFAKRATKSAVFMCSLYDL